jgi:hypothetical protein
MTHVEILVEGHLDPQWADWLDGFTITHTENNETVLIGTVEDQSAFYGIMAKLRDLGVKLISANFSGQTLDDKSE